MTILIDIDSTITDFGKTLLHILNQFNDHHEYSEITTYNWFNETYSDPWYPLTKKEFWDNVHVNTKAIKVIESWIDKGYDIYLVSASGFHDALGYKIHKTLSAFNKLDESNVIIARDKNMVKGDILIDDCIDNLKEFEGMKICYAQPWNKEWNYVDGNGGLREDDWKEIDSLVNWAYEQYFAPKEFEGDYLPM